MGIALTSVAVKAEIIPREEYMFEELQEEEKEIKEIRKHQIWISAVIILVLTVIGTLAYVVLKPHPNKTPLSAQSPAPSVKATPPDPAHDLQVVRAVMGKDVTGVRVIWSVQMRNKSTAHTYGDIQYEARFIRPDGTTLAVSRDTIKTSIGPGEEIKIPQFIDGIYDASAATYSFVLTGAKTTAQ